MKVVVGRAGGRVLGGFLALRREASLKERFLSVARLAGHCFLALRREASLKGAGRGNPRRKRPRFLALRREASLKVRAFELVGVPRFGFLALRREASLKAVLRRTLRTRPARVSSRFGARPH